MLVVPNGDFQRVGSGIESILHLVLLVLADMDLAVSLRVGLDIRHGLRVRRSVVCLDRVTGNRHRGILLRVGVRVGTGESSTEFSLPAIPYIRVGAVVIGVILQPELVVVPECQHVIPLFVLVVVLHVQRVWKLALHPDRAIDWLLRGES